MEKPFDKAKKCECNNDDKQIKGSEEKSKNYPERFTQAKHEWIRYS